MVKLAGMLMIEFVCAMLPVICRSQEPLFQLLSPKQTNIRFNNLINENESLNVLAYEYFYNGGAVAVADINNDGMQDLFFTANTRPNKLYLNEGGMKFRDITKEAGLEGRSDGWKTGATIADINGDGLPDVYVCYSGKVPEDLRRNQLYINQGQGRFIEKSKEFGLDDPSYSTQAAFFDFDNDGDLDMFLLNHNVKKYDNMQLASFRNQTDEFAGSKLYENRDNKFFDISRQAGIHQYPLTFGLGIAISDVNMDGWQDIYVTNDYNEPDYLYINKKNRTFDEQTQKSLRHISQFSMGVDVADFNNDALPDIITLDMLPEDNRRQKLLQLQENYESFDLMISQNLHKQYMRNMLHVNNGDGTFSEIGQLAGVSNTDWSWCPLFADFDNDGYKDLFVTTGYLRDYTNKDFLRYWGDYKIKKAIDREPMLLMDLIKAMPVTPFYNYIYRNDHGLTFTNKQKEWGFGKAMISGAAAYADLDNDGDLDLVISQLNDPASIYMNMSRQQLNAPGYVSIKLKGFPVNTTAIGAKVFVYADGIQYQEVNPNRGYLSCVSTVLNFGLGNRSHIDSIKIIWPDQSTALVTNVTANSEITVTYKRNTPNDNKMITSKKPLFEKTMNFIEYNHDDFADNDFKRQLLMLFMYSKTGPVAATADINKDGLEDVFICGDEKKRGRFYIQQEGGRFVSPENIQIGDENMSATSAAEFFDANGDGFEDLYVAKGGYSLFEAGSLSLQDELYLNDGMGGVVLAKTAIPNVSSSSKSCVRPCDYDGDGDMDVFIGGRVIPGKYPLPPESFLLQNDGKAAFTAVPVPFANAGMITDAAWADLNVDGRKDLVLCGEMMPVMVYENTPAGFIDKTADYFSSPEKGFWFSLAIADINGDGQPDLLAGNLGLNSQIRASEKEPAELYYADFDGNGSIDPFFNFYVQGVSYPFVSRDELNEQIYPMRKKFTSYKDYADATMKDIFTEEELSKAERLTATDTRSVCFINRNGKFEKSVLPLQAQFSAVSKIIVKDFTGDGMPDILLFGNQSFNRLKIGSLDANYGCLLAGDGKGNFRYIDQPSSGICIMGDVKAVEELKIENNRYLLIGIGNEPVQFYKEP